MRGGDLDVVVHVSRVVLEAAPVPVHTHVPPFMHLCLVAVGVGCWLVLLQLLQGGDLSDGCSSFFC